MNLFNVGSTWGSGGVPDYTQPGQQKRKPPLIQDEQPQMHLGVPRMGDGSENMGLTQQPQPQPQPQQQPQPQELAGSALFHRIGQAMEQPVAPQPTGGGGYHTPMPKANFPSYGGLNVNPMWDALTARQEEAAPHNRAMAGYDESDRAIQQMMHQALAKYMPMEHQVGLASGIQQLGSQPQDHAMKLLEIASNPMLRTTPKVGPDGRPVLNSAGQPVMGLDPRLEQALSHAYQVLSSGGGGGGGTTNTGTTPSPQNPPAAPQDQAGFLRTAIHSAIPAGVGAAAWPLIGKLPLPAWAKIPLQLAGSVGAGAGAEGLEGLVDPGFGHLNPDAMGRLVGWGAGVLGGLKAGGQKMGKGKTPTAPPTQPTPSGPGANVNTQRPMGWEYGEGGGGGPGPGSGVGGAGVNVTQPHQAEQFSLPFEQGFAKQTVPMANASAPVANPSLAGAAGVATSAATAAPKGAKKTTIPKGGVNPKVPIATNPVQGNMGNVPDPVLLNQLGLTPAQVEAILAKYPQANTGKMPIKTKP